MKRLPSLLLISMALFVAGCANTDTAEPAATSQESTTSIAPTTTLAATTQAEPVEDTAGAEEDTAEAEEDTAEAEEDDTAGATDDGTVAQIEQARATWEAARPGSYSYIAQVGSSTEGLLDCGSDRVRVVVANGSITQARDIDSHCDVPLDAVVGIDAMFDRAIEGAAGLEGQIVFDQRFGFVADYYSIIEDAGDPAGEPTESWINVFGLTGGAIPLSTDGPDARTEALTAARSRWEAAGITSYQATLDVRCFCDVQGPIDVTVEENRVVAVSEEPSEAYPLLMSELFGEIEQLLGGDHAELAFHPELGYPVAAFLDPDVEISDDEFGYLITELVPAP